jgi:hypothetical protein
MLKTSLKGNTRALKEWDVAVNALRAGKTIILLRKGGIREENKNFQVFSCQFWLYPTYEHQKPELLKAKYASQVTPVEKGWYPDTVCLTSYAEIDRVFCLQNPEQIKALEPYHIWNHKMVSDRLKWKSQQPLSVLLLRVYRLDQPLKLAYRETYKGCKSWIDLLEPIDSQSLIPALRESIYRQKVLEICKLVDS